MKCNAICGVAILVAATICIAAVVYIRVEDLRAQGPTMQVDLLTKKIEQGNLTISLGFQDQKERTPVTITITAASIMILDRLEVAHNDVYNQTFERTVAEDLDVLFFTNLTTIHPGWIYRVTVRCRWSTDKHTEHQFYIF